MLIFPSCGAIEEQEMLQVNLEGSGHATPTSLKVINGDTSAQFVPFPYTLPVSFPGTPEQVADIANGKRLHVLNWAMNYVDTKIKKHQPCNACFKKLPRHKTLLEIWDSNDVWVSYFTTTAALGETRGDRDIAVSESAFKEGRMTVVATIMHELAHIAGAPGGKALEDGKPNNQAESVLKCCLLGDMFDPNALGAIDKVLDSTDASSSVA
jgi:hypothetical protein